jgi:hypothetical protein
MSVRENAGPCEPGNRLLVKVVKSPRQFTGKREQVQGDGELEW